MGCPSAATSSMLTSSRWPARWPGGDHSEDVNQSLTPASLSATVDARALRIAARLPTTLFKPRWRNEMRKIRSAAMAFPLAALVFATVGVLAPLSVSAAPCATSTSGGTTSLSFCYAGAAAQTWTVPAGVHSVKFTVFGGAGGAGAAGSNPAGGLGGKAVATVAVVPGST